MKHQKKLQFCLVWMLGCVCSVSNAHMTSVATEALAPQALEKHMAAVRVPFIKNQGQIANDDVQFYAKTFAGTLFVTKENHLVYSLPQNNHNNAAAAWAFRESFVGQQQTHPQGESKSPVRVSYYKGNNSRAWHKQLAAFDSIGLGELYPGIRVSLKAAGNNVEKLFYVSPGAATDAINIDIEGVQSISINKERQLVLDTALGDIIFSAPIAYQMVDGKRQLVDVAYALADGHYGFKVGEYDKYHELVIDPLLASTYIGGHNPSPPGNYDDDIILGMAASGGDIYVAGVTQSPDFPIVLGYDDTLPNAYPDGFIALLSGDLSTVIASTYFGTDGFDRISDLALDDDGSVVVVGQAGYGFPVTDGAYTWSGSTPTGGGFVARFSDDLSTLLASSIPTPSDFPGQVALGNGGIYFGGATNNTSFPITPGAYKDTCCPAGSFGIRDYDGFAGKLSSDLGTLEAMTYLGGDAVSGISVAPDGNVYITDGSDYEITGYISRMDAGLTTRSSYLTYYPGSQSGSSRTYFNEVVAGDGFVVTAGQTYMNDLPTTPGAFDTTCGSNGVCDGIGPLLYPRSDGFIAVYSADLSQTLALTYLGGSDEESIRALELGADGTIYVSGETTSEDFPTSNNGADTSCGTDGQCDATGPYTSFADGFIARLSPDLSQLHYGSYLGGSGEDHSLVLALDDIDQVYVAGYTRSADFPTTGGAFDITYNGGTSDAFISQFDIGGTPPPISDIKANGSDDSVLLTQGDKLTVGISLDPGGYISENADWWLLLIYYNPNTGTWVSVPLAGFQQPLFELPYTQILSTTGLPSGQFIFFFGVDMIPNGTIDMSQIYFDYVPVIVTP